METLEKLLEAAKVDRRIQSIGWVIAENPTHHQHNFVGARGLEMSIISGLEVLKLRVIEHMTSSHMQAEEAMSEDDDPQACGYDITEGPACFDFFCWLVIQDMRRRRRGVPGPLKVGFRMLQTEEEKGVHDQLRKSFYEKVIFPGVGLIGGVIDGQSSMRPAINKYTFAPIVEAAKRGEYVPRLQPSEDAKTAVKDYIGEDSPPIVTITLREAGMYEYRNSNLPEWLKVASHIQGQGYRVVFVRDTKMASEEVEGFESCPSASFDIDVRLALYEAAAANLFVSNGPWYLALLGSKPWLMFVLLESMAPFFPETPQFWRQWHGIDPNAGEQFPWQTPLQRIVPERDNADIIIPEWDNLHQSLTADDIAAGLARP